MPAGLPGSLVHSERVGHGKDQLIRSIYPIHVFKPRFLAVVEMIAEIQIEPQQVLGKANPAIRIVESLFSVGAFSGLPDAADIAVRLVVMSID